MAGKKHRSRNANKSHTSQGVHSCVNNATKRAVRADFVASGDRLLAQRDAFDKGKKTMVTIENPNKEETNKRFIRIEGKYYFKPKSLPQKKTKSNQADWGDAA